MTSAASSQAGALPAAPRRRRAAAFTTGLIVAVLVLAGGWLLYVDRPTEYEASSTLVVLPSADLLEAASYYDTLSQGQIVTTFAEILALQAGEVDVAGETATVTVTVVPETSLIEITGTAGDEATAQTATDAVLDRSTPLFAELPFPYQVTPIQSAADGTPQEVGLSADQLKAVVAAVAVIAGIATYLAVQALLPSRRLVPARQGRSRASSDQATRVAPDADASRANGHPVSRVTEEPSPVLASEDAPVSSTSAR